MARRIQKVHRTSLKLIVNPLLRKIQYWTDTPFVIASLFNDNKEFVTYKLARVKYDKYKMESTDIQIVEVKVKNPIIKTIKHIFK